MMKSLLEVVSLVMKSLLEVVSLMMTALLDAPCSVIQASNSCLESIGPAMHSQLLYALVVCPFLEAAASVMLFDYLLLESHPVAAEHSFCTP